MEGEAASGAVAQSRYATVAARAARCFRYQATANSHTNTNRPLTKPSSRIQYDPAMSELFTVWFCTSITRPVPLHLSFAGRYGLSFGITSAICSSRNSSVLSAKSHRSVRRNWRFIR
uniref:Uncharacterized protein n=1 Tax=Anopheles melas TaxID=34690 RepID=A0A182UJ22_9DIPT